MYHIKVEQAAKLSITLAKNDLFRYYHIKFSCPFRCQENNPYPVLLESNHHLKCRGFQNDELAFVDAGKSKLRATMDLD